MSYFEHIIHKLQQDQHIPKQVLEKRDEILVNLPDDNQSGIKRKGHKGIAVAAAVLLGISIFFCGSNPAIAAKIPFIGKIFEKVEEDVPFAGDYSKKAESLTVEEVGDLDSSSTKKDEWSVTDAGITITATEIYCDGLSIFLSAQVRVDQGGLQAIPSYHVIGKDTESAMLYVDGNWSVVHEGDQQTLNQVRLEGKVLDDCTFIGMMKLDMTEKDMEQGTLYLQMSTIGWDDMTTESTQDISASHQINGQWSFAIPFHVDTEATKEFEVKQEKDGFAIQNVFVSPYQVVTYIETPTTIIEKTITRTDYEKKLGLQEGEEAPDMSYEQFVDAYGTSKKVTPCETVICNQDGEILPAQEMSTTAGTTVFAVNGKEITTLHVYLFIDSDEKSDYQGIIDMEDAKNRAIVSAEILIE